MNQKLLIIWFSPSLFLPLFSQDKVTELQDRVDHLYADFSSQSAENISEKEAVTRLESEVNSQSALLSQAKPGSQQHQAHEAALKNSTKQLSEARNKLQRVQVALEVTSAKLDEAKKALADKTGSPVGDNQATDSNKPRKWTVGSWLENSNIWWVFLILTKWY